MLQIDQHECGDDGDKTDDFFVSQPTYRAFKYDADGVSVWYGVTLNMRMQGVET